MVQKAQRDPMIKFRPNHPLAAQLNGKVKRTRLDGSVSGFGDHRMPIGGKKEEIGRGLAIPA